MNEIMTAYPHGYMIALSYTMCAFLFCLLNPRRASLGIRILLYILLPTLNVFLNVLMDIGNDFLYFPLLFLSNVGSYLLLFLCCEMNRYKALYFSAISFIYGEFLTTISWQFWLFFVKNGTFAERISDEKLQLWCYFGIGFLLWCSLFLVERRRRNDNAHMKIYGKDLFSTFLIVVSVFLFSNISNVLKDTPFSGDTAMQINLIRGLVDLVGILILKTNQIFREELTSKAEVEVMQKVLEMQYANLQVSEQSIALIHQKYHDLKHQIAYLKETASGEERMRSLNQIEEEIRSFEAGSSTGNHIVDTILTAKMLQCQNMGIRMTITGDGKLLDFLSPMDLSALLGNLLDNAIENVDKLSEEKRWIQFSIRKKMNFVIIEVGNPCEQQLEFHEGLPVTTKKDTRFHGYGTRSIWDTAAKYGGTAAFSQKKDWFEAKVVFVKVNKNQE